MALSMSLGQIFYETNKHLFVHIHTYVQSHFKQFRDNLESCLTIVAVFTFQMLIGISWQWSECSTRSIHFEDGRILERKFLSDFRRSEEFIVWLYINLIEIWSLRPGFWGICEMQLCKILKMVVLWNLLYSTGVIVVLYWLNLVRWFYKNQFNEKSFYVGTACWLFSHHCIKIQCSLIVSNSKE